MYTTEFWVDRPINIFAFAIGTPSEILNLITLLTILLAIIISVALSSVKILYFELIIIAFIAILNYMIFFTAPESESFLRTPTKNNPFMNVPLEAYDAPQEYPKGYEKYKVPLIPTPRTEKIQSEVESKWEDRLFQDSNGRLFNHNNSQRQYISQPIQKVPNDQATFAYWLYGKKPYEVCKAGSIWDRYGKPFTQESLSCTGFNASSPTNLGIKEM